MQYRRSQTNGGSFFFTVVTHKRQRILCVDENILLLKEAFSHIIAKYPFTVDAFVFLPDHIHCVWTMPENDGDFSTRWRLIKSYFSARVADRHDDPRTASRIKKGEQGIWQRRFWEHSIRDQRDLNRHIEYIHYNPVRHGIVRSPRDWPYSSFHEYVNDGIFDVDWGAGENIEFDECVGNE